MAREETQNDQADKSELQQISGYKAAKRKLLHQLTLSQFMLISSFVIPSIYLYGSHLLRDDKVILVGQPAIAIPSEFNSSIYGKGISPTLANDLASDDEMKEFIDM